MFMDMEKWAEIRFRVLNDEISKRAACAEYKIHWETLQKILTHQVIVGRSHGDRSWNRFCRSFTKFSRTIRRFIGNNDIPRSGSLSVSATSTGTTAARRSSRMQ